jgi:hypothetical protein
MAPEITWLVNASAFCTCDEVASQAWVTCVAEIAPTTAMPSTAEIDEIKATAKLEKLMTAKIAKLGQIRLMVV